MNNSSKVIQELKDIYKPYRLTKKKNVTIIDSTSGSFVVKEKSDERIKEVYSYLASRNFDYFPELCGKNRSDVNIFQYIDEAAMPKEQKAMDMMELVGLLHNKTTYYKEISEDKYKEIYDNIKNNILYVKNYYDNLYNIYIEEVYMSPSHYLLMRNIYKIFAACDFCMVELDEWFDEARQDLKERVVLNHNNLALDHFIKNKKGYLVSWDKAKIDSPILDLINFYQREYMDLDFGVLWEKYFKSYPLSLNEKKLLFIVISVPPVIDMVGGEMEVTKRIRTSLDYLFKTESLVEIFKTSDEDK